MKVVNPSTEEVTELSDTPVDEVGSMVAEARNAQQTWGEVPVSERAKIVQTFCDIAGEHKEDIAQVLAEDVGKPLSKGRFEVDKALLEVKNLCSNASDWIGPEEVAGATVHYDPLGVVAVISPWNFPFSVSLRGIIPALLAGNGVVYKPSEYSSLTGVLLSGLVKEIEGLPKEILQLFLGGKEHGKALVASDIDMVSFTGSTVAGKDIMRTCAERLVPVQLELGGMDAAIVLKDADLESAAKAIVERNCSNTGQVCCSIKRVYVEEEIYSEFAAEAAKISEAIEFGPPEEDKAMGPLVAEFQYTKIVDIVEDAKEKGAQILSGGKAPERTGYFYPSTVMTEVTDDMRVIAEEPFGPILPLQSISSWEEGVVRANNSQYGLTGSVWTSDEELGRTIAEKLQVGVARVNAHGPGPVGTPWGGAKESGIGRMGTREGLREYTSVKTIA